MEYNMVDPEVIESKLRYLREYLVDLREYENISVSAYRSNKKDQRFIERTLQLACECCLDIASHVISRRGMREPRDNKDMFLVLYEGGIISEQIHEAMVKMARFRNLIVHDYARIDPEAVVGILRKNLKDLKGFSKEIIKYLENVAG
jgi:uncharacterized protein YutE (UPF0331/DUF86 family)